jgi:hypothetical protein
MIDPLDRIVPKKVGGSVLGILVIFLAVRVISPPETLDNPPMAIFPGVILRC